MTNYSAQDRIGEYETSWMSPGERGELAAFEEDLNRSGWMGNAAAFAMRAHEAGHFLVEPLA